ncbi:translation initiation factor IF-2-like [Helianthus annuus]|uniref:translation initiation factor IF-2-like n=1 Tax=Helianthus annuus TaxID=4232 RepID=UPI001652FC5D|nr:translation initiation factor IF-2-like [Helianthus annuus]
MNEMQEEYESAIMNKRWDKKRECYFNREGEPVVPKKNIIFEDVLLIIPSSAEYYRNVLKDDTYAKRHEKEIKYAMISCLRKRDEERMKKSVEEMLINLKKVVVEIKAEAVQVEVEKKVEVVKEEDLKVVETEKIEEKVVEDEKKTESLTEVKIENFKSASDEGAGDEKKEELKQTEAPENTKVPITEVLKKNEDCEDGNWSSLADGKEKEAAGPCVG